MNKLIIDGNLTKDMEVSTLASGTVIGTFTIANNRGFGDNQRTSFIRCNIFGEKRVESLEKYLLKGAKVLICGELDVTSKEYEEGYANFTSLIVDDLQIIRFVNDEEEEESKKKTKTKKKTYKK